MVVSDLLRAAIILVIPIAAVTNILLVYPLVFAITSVSIFFRPARIAALPRIVREDELLTANSAMWVGETIADVIGYPLAAVFVGFLGSALPLAFWIDAATYAASAALIATIHVPAAARTPHMPPGERPTDPRRPEGGLHGSCAARRCCSRTRSRRRSASSRSASLTALTPFYASGDRRRARR